MVPHPLLFPFSNILVQHTLHISASSLPPLLFQSRKWKEEQGRKIGKQRWLPTISLLPASVGILDRMSLISISYHINNVWRPLAGLCKFSMMTHVHVASNCNSHGSVEKTMGWLFLIASSVANATIAATFTYVLFSWESSCVIPPPTQHHVHEGHILQVGRSAENVVTTRMERTADVPWLLCKYYAAQLQSLMAAWE